MSLSPELAALRDEAMATSCASWAIQKRWGLRGRHEMVGACPNPECVGGGGVDRFSINTVKNVFNCRKCGISGEGVIKLVMDTEHVDFVRACEIVTGRTVSEPIDEAKAERARRERAAELARRERAAEAYRERARRDGLATWSAGLPLEAPEAQPVLDYLARRALDIRGLEQAPLSMFHALRCAPELAWTEAYINPETGNRGWSTLHVGPAMLAHIVLPVRLQAAPLDARLDPLGRFGGVHMTWIDLGAPKGRLVLPDAPAEGREGKGKPRPTKKVRGRKKGCVIPLFTPAGARRLVMGEGIESTLTPLVHAFEPDTAYWAGIDLGNIAGAPMEVDGRKIWDEPDLDDLECFIPPDWVEEFVLLGEGDDASVHSREKSLCGLRRAKLLRERARLERAELPALTGIYVPPPDGDSDMNDLARRELGEGNDATDTTAAADGGPQAVGRADAIAADRTERRGEDGAR
ncbi:MAG: hypothetical protein BGO82_17135 [Devosia sp. 67-54]|uniref:hypothetical protein n=1 Tax=unclassified Devosia TaxID=196773 RepID=UPI000966E803|nr:MULTISPECIES: hypothetical protein [unclassified Devosia]MBN9304098.1 hypothetical protein [Devosia sp.]OJX17934.1 MAG: hypothetical protein BGO82_17135 [Devosia sp. 67-54]